MIYDASPVCGARCAVVFCIVLKNLYLKDKKTTEKRESAALNIFSSTKWRQNALCRHVWIEVQNQKLHYSEGFKVYKRGNKFFLKSLIEECVCIRSPTLKDSLFIKRRIKSVIEEGVCINQSLLKS